MRVHLSRAAIWLVISYALVGCSAGGFRDRLLRDGGADGTPEVRSDETDAGPPLLVRCVPAIAADALPARQALMDGAGPGTGGGALYIADLFAMFKTHCGDCHADGRNNGGLDVKVSTFSERITDEVLARIRSEDPAIVMPRPVPGGPSRFSERSADDPVVRLASLLEQWLAQGKQNVLYPDADAVGGRPGDSSFLLSPAVGMSMTNLGHCVPSTKPAHDEAAAQRAAELDLKFAALKRFDELPKSLEDTDLFTLDSEVLAQHGVLAFAPAYTLWADNAKKLRLVRVPRGESIIFDKEAQAFRIPANTRFYKTFFKPVTDIHGNVRYRKMETRLIVARSDAERMDGKDYVPSALFGTYKWNEQETEARLLTEPYRDGTGFTDHIESYVVDERLEDQVLREGPDDLDRMLELGAKRHYALPGADRCIHCHMGAPDRSFVLGFTPLQIRRRPLGEGGVIEPAEEHELNQLERLIDYGVIAGMVSPEEVVLLEKSQGEREPRNEHELAAQGYMLGNCAHCHNPLGFPSWREKVLADVLDFFPSPTGGIFQFPLDRFSPRSLRGPDQNILIPYITPSLFDHPIALQANVGTGGEVMRQGLKWIADDAEIPESVPLLDRFSALAPLLLTKGRPLFAPWRSLIYRNVDAPFSYEDGATIFPHMPMDTAGYDCRARRLLGDWMASIPARLVTPTVGDFGEMASAEDQPYVGVSPEDPDYERVVAEAEARLQRFRDGERYHDCPAEALDVVAPDVSSGLALLPKPQLTKLGAAVGDGLTQSYWLLSPARAHYPKTDLHDDLTWLVRRSDWYQVLVEDGVDPVKDERGGYEADESARAIAMVRTLRLDQAFREFALTERPFGLWTEKPQCAAKLSQQRKVSELQGAARPAWLDVVAPPADARVYTIAPGAQVFNTICSKCHGPDATGRSSLASTIADLTGGLTRVANLRDGLFGPPGRTGSNRRREYDRADGQLGGSAEDWAARYLVWMGLGGTNAAIPKTVLTQVGSARVLGQDRKSSLGTVDAKAAANMLGVAKEACARLLPSSNTTAFDPRRGGFRRTQELVNGRPRKGQITLEEIGLIPRNGDAELWEALCRYDNPQPVRVVHVSDDAGYFVVKVPFPGEYTYVYRREVYPANAPIGDHEGRVIAGLGADNLAPWCLGKFDNEKQAAFVAKIEAEYGYALPRCPASFLNDSSQALTMEQGKLWATRGAANVGLSVYVYLEALAKGTLKPKPAYDRCEDL